MTQQYDKGGLVATASAVLLAYQVLATSKDDITNVLRLFDQLVYEMNRRISNTIQLHDSEDHTSCAVCTAGLIVFLGDNYRSAALDAKP